MSRRGGEHADADGAPPRAGRYLLGRVLGAGAMGVVRASYDPALDREIAVKVLGPRDVAMLRDTDDPTRSRLLGTEGPASITSAAIDDAQLLAEARALARVAHPNIVEVFDVGVWEGGVFLAMELVDGVSLRTWNGEHAPDWRTAIAMHVQAGDALAAAHAVGIVHGDFKPDNVLVTATDRVKVVDFGLARAIGRVEADDRSAVVFGTPAYLAPECWDDASRQPSADQFAFFVSLCEAITNRRPYARVDSLTALLLALQDGPQLDALRRLAPSRVVRIVARGLDPDPARRFATMSEALGELQAVVAHDRRWRRRWFVAAAGLGAALPLAALATAPHLRERASLADCTTTALSIGEVWNDDARTRVSAAMTQADARIGAVTATRAIGWLDAYAAEWSALAEATCTAGVAEPSDLEHARTRCFAERSAALAAFIEVLEAADADVVRNAVVAATELPRIDACNDTAWLGRHRDDGSMSDLDEVDRDLARAQQLVGSGRGEDALALVANLEVSGSDRRRVARIRATRGRAIARLGRYDDAAAELEAAYFAARELDDDASAAIAVELAAVLGDKMGRLDDARVWARHAETALASIGGPEGETHARLLLAVAAADLRRGDFEGSIRSAERALALRRELHGDEHPGVALAELGLGKALGQLGRLDEAAACFERALAILERALGPEHIDLAGAYHDLGLVSTQRGDYSTARANEERALAIRQLWLPPDHPDIATALVGLSYVDLGLQRYDDAVIELERALAIREAKFGQTHPAVAATLAALAQVASKRGDCREAIGFLERALAVSERADAGDRRARVRFTLGLADALSGCREHDAARRQYEAARALAEAEPNGFAEELDRARRGLAAVMGG